MARSYLFVADKQLDILFQKDIFNADAIVINLYDYEQILDDYEKYQDLFTQFHEKNIKVYLKVDSNNIKRTYSILNRINDNRLSGWVIPYANHRILNRFNMKARDFEVQKRLNYGTINFIATIDTPNGVIEARRIASYERVEAILVDCPTYLRYLGVEEDSKNTNSDYLRQQISLCNGLSKKKFIDTFCIDDEKLANDIEIGKRLGCFAKATNSLEQLPIINQAYTPSDLELAKAKTIVELFRSAQSKYERRHLQLDGQYISPNQIIRSNYIVERASILNGDDLNVLPIKVVDEKIKKKKPYNIMKFYSFGEEVGNAVTHGVGIILGIVFLVMLILKGVKLNADTTTMLAYISYGLSAICLYFMSTMYHGLPTGGAGKRLFQRFDHMTIYLLIAGTYTPFSLLALGGLKGTILCIYLWVGAIIGLGLNLFFWRRFRIFHMVLYVMLGWTAILFIPELVVSLGTLGMILLIGGGLAYTLGIIFYSLKLFKYTHMIWHIFVLAGTILHFLAIYLCL